MKRFFLMLILALSSISLATQSVQAQSAGGLKMVGTPTSTHLCITRGSALPFVWIRAAPSSYARVLLTLFPNDYEKLTAYHGQTESFDGTQWWVQVGAFPNAVTYATGWVEETAISLSCLPTGPNDSAHYYTGSVCIRPGLPYAWLRRSPSSYAPPGATMSSGHCQRSPGQLPWLTAMSEVYWDGVQWWQMVGIPPREFSAKYWVEQSALHPLTG